MRVSLAASFRTLWPRFPAALRHTIFATLLTQDGRPERFLSFRVSPFKNLLHHLLTVCRVTPSFAATVPCDSPDSTIPTARERRASLDRPVSATSMFTNDPRSGPDPPCDVMWRPRRLATVTLWATVRNYRVYKPPPGNLRPFMNVEQNAWLSPVNELLRHPVLEVCTINHSAGVPWPRYHNDKSMPQRYREWPRRASCRMNPHYQCPYHQLNSNQLNS